MTSRNALPSNPFRAPERALAAQTRLDEFEIERVLAQSSFAVVYRAYDHALKLHVAIKEYLPDALALRSAETQVVLRARAHAERFGLGLQAFIDEAQTLARCDHPALLRIARILQRHGTAYRVMRYSPGPTLLAHRRELAATPDAQALRGWLDALLGALDALHEEGCVHGAVAPGNILLLPGDRPMLLDFEAVRTALISDRTQSMMTALEPCFEPIEQRAPTGDSAMGPWSDLYALAATMHFCIGGELPAPPSGAQTAQAFEPLAAVWRRLRSARPESGEAPSWLSALDACLREAPARRPQSVAQLRGLLGAAATAPWSASLPGSGAAAWSTEPSAARPAASRPGVPAALQSEAQVTSASPHAGTPPPAAAPARASAAMEASHAKVMADLDQTFALIAAQASEDAAPATAVAAAGVGEEAQAAAAATDRPATEGPASGKPLSRWQWWLAAAAALSMLLAMAATVVWLFRENQPGLVGGGGMDGMQSVTAPVPAPTDGAGKPGNTADESAAPAAGPAARNDKGRNNGHAAAPPAEPSAATAKPRPAPNSPREACGERTRFALYQCMKTQCDKPAWTKHAQCARLRKEQKLG